MRLPRSLQGRLLALVLGLVGVVWACTAALTWRDASHELDELLDGHLAQAAALLVVQQSHEVAEAGETPQEHAAEQPGASTLNTPNLHRYAPRVAFQVFHEGQLVLRSANAPALPMVAPERGFREGFTDVTAKGQAWRVFAAYGAEADVQVYVGEQAAARDEILLAVLRSTLWPMALALPLLAGVAGWAIRRGLQPLRALGDQLRQRPASSLAPLELLQTGSDRSSRATTATPPTEVQQMMQALDGLFERIASLMERERRFTADAAHELRTPIAAIRTQAQVALHEADAGQRRHALQATLDGCDRATRLVEQLLTLSRLEASAAPPTRVVDLAALARQAVADIAPRALVQGQTVALDAPATCPVNADETLLAVLLRNLLDNAVRYSPSGATVHVSLAAAGPEHPGRVRLTVEDSGPGLPSEVQEQLGRRFQRPAGLAQRGSGLGWSIVRRIAEVLRIELQLTCSPTLGGLAVQAWLAPVPPS